LKVTEYFTAKDLMCRCCGDLPAKEPQVLHFYEKLDELRSLCKFEISDAYRCPERDKKVSLNAATAGHGVHTMGVGVHIPCCVNTAHKILSNAFKVGFTGIGINQDGPYELRFIHLDTITTEEGGIAHHGRPWVWCHRSEPSIYNY
tara:strand:- start:104 stop:541 length:438 start_codon:yes stop_codon:yes gene_type:complete